VIYSSASSHYVEEPALVQSDEAWLTVALNKPQYDPGAGMVTFFFADKSKKLRFAEMLVEQLQVVILKERLDGTSAASRSQEMVP